MLTHKIKAPGLVKRLVDTVFNGVNLDPTPRTPVPVTSVSRLLPDMRYDKQKFIQFVEKTRESFKIGDLVTYASQPEVRGLIPVSAFRVVYIQELWYDVQYDYACGEPKLLMLRNINYEATHDMHQAPCRLRQLTNEEKSLVDLRDSKVQGSA